jgi:hypothetical protein
LKVFKTHKNLYTRLLCITDPKYEPHDQETQSFGQFLPQTGVFVEPNAITFGFGAEILKKIKPIKTYVIDHYV